MSDRLSNPSHYVLLIESEVRETEIYTDLVNEVASCKIDVMSRIGSSFDWIERSNYHLIIIDEAALSASIAEQKVLVMALLERIKRMSPDTSVIVMSEHATVEQAVTAIRLGAEDYLKKPFNLESFKLAIKRGLDRKTVYADSGMTATVNLLNSCQLISAAMDQGRIFRIIQSYFSRELDSNFSAIYSIEKNRPIRVDVLGSDEAHDNAMEEILDIAVQAANPFKSIEGTDYKFVERGQLTPGLFVYRFKSVGPNDYYCVCLSPIKPSSMDAFDSRIKMLSAQLQVSGSNVRQYMGVRNLAYMDDVTGLYNTRYLNFVLDREVKSAKLKKKSFAVLFIDADHFKQVNDQHGHLVGSKLLSELGRLVRKLVRDTDVVFRYGGDEFVAVLAPCDIGTAKVVAERIRHATELNSFLSSENLDIRFTVTIGVALFPDHATSKKEVIDKADKVMFEGKKIRNSVYVADSKSKNSKAKKLPKTDAKLLKA